jgi:hypothetical protein
MGNPISVPHQTSTTKGTKTTKNNGAFGHVLTMKREDVKRFVLHGLILHGELFATEKEVLRVLRVLRVEVFLYGNVVS